MRPYVRLLRPKQWTKNFLVFGALIFSRMYDSGEAWVQALLAFAAFCLVSSATYVVNDLIDAKKDREHPVKRLRPIASGAVSPVVAAGLASGLALAGLALAYTVNLPTLEVIAGYAVLQALYNGALKRWAVADVFGISMGFVLRAVAGATALSVSLSGWILVCTGLLALMLGFGKRLHEFKLEDRGATRESLEGYTQRGLEALVLMSGCAAALSYAVYSIESETARRHGLLVLTAPVVFYGVCRYVTLLFSTGETGEPESILLRDRHIQGAVGLFLALAVFALTRPTPPLLTP